MANARQNADVSLSIVQEASRPDLKSGYALVAIAIYLREIADSLAQMKKSCAEPKPKESA